jgi:hypothetical protein
MGKGVLGASFRSASVYDGGAKPDARVKKTVTFVSPPTGTNKRPSPRHWSQETDENDGGALASVTGSALEDAVVGAGASNAGAYGAEEDGDVGADGSRRAVTNTPRVPSKKKVKVLG